MATGLSATTVFVSCPTTLGLKTYCFEVATNGTELSKTNNYLCTNLTFRTSARLSFSPDDIVIDIENGNISVVVYNYGSEGVDEVSLPVYQYVASQTPILLGTTTPFNISASSVQFTYLGNLVDIFASANLETFTLQIDLPSAFTSDGTVSSTFVTLENAESNSLPDLPPGITLFQALKLLAANWLVDLTEASATSALTVRGFNVLHANTFTLNYTSLPPSLNFASNNYSRTGIAYLDYVSNQFLYLDPVTAQTEHSIEVALILNEDLSLLDQLTFNFTIKACPDNMFTCKDFTCVATAAACGSAAIRCPLSSPVLYENSCITLSAFAQTTSASAGYNVTVPTFTESLFVAGPFTFTIPSNFISSASQKALLYLSPSSDVPTPPALSSAFTLRVVDNSSLSTFAQPVSIIIPSWNLSIHTSADLSALCLAVLNVDQWECDPSSTLSVVSFTRRSGTQVAASTKSTGVMAVVPRSTISIIATTSSSTTSTATSTTETSTTNKASTTCTPTTTSTGTSAKSTASATTSASPTSGASSSSAESTAANIGATSNTAATISPATTSANGATTSANGATSSANGATSSIPTTASTSSIPTTASTSSIPTTASTSSSSSSSTTTTPSGTPNPTPVPSIQVTQVVVTQQMTGDYDTFDTTEYANVVASSLGEDSSDVKSTKYIGQRRADSFFVATTITLPADQNVSDTDLEQSITAQLNSSSVRSFLGSSGVTAATPTFTITHNVTPAPSSSTTNSPSSTSAPTSSTSSPTSPPSSTVAPTSSPTSPPSSSTSAPLTGASTTQISAEEHHKKSNSLSVGLGVGLSLGFVVVIAVIAVVVYRLRKRRNNPEAQFGIKMQAMSTYNIM